MGINFEGSNRPRWIPAGVTGALMGILILSMVPSATATQPSTDIQPPAGAIISALPAGAISTSGLQMEIDEAAPGATVHIPAGTYVGQLRVAKDLNLVGAGEGSTILQSPVKMIPDFLGNVFEIEVSDHSSVQISKLTVQVTEQCMLANSIGVATGGGVGVRDASTLTIWDVDLVALGPDPNLNMPCTTHGSAGMLSFGRAISIGLDDGPGIGTNVEVEGHGTVKDVSTAGFDIFSISVGGVRGPSGSTATILNNLVRVGPGPYTAAYGIVVYGVSTVSNNLVVGVPGSDGGIAVVDTSAVVTDNTVNNFICTTAPFPITPPCGVNPSTEDQDLGIFLASITPGTIVQGNSIHLVDAGILVEGPGAPAVIVHNSITANTYYGLDLIDANQTFLHDVVVGGSYAIAVVAGISNSTAVLDQDTIHGYSVSLSLLQSVSPWIAKVVVEPY
jgi:hypothetical protein